MSDQNTTTIGTVNGQTPDSLTTPSAATLAAIERLERASRHHIAIQEVAADLLSKYATETVNCERERRSDYYKQVHEPLEHLDRACDWWSEQYDDSACPFTEEHADLVAHVLPDFKRSLLNVPYWNASDSAAIRALLWHHREALALKPEWVVTKRGTYRNNGDDEEGHYDYSSIVEAMQRANADRFDPTPHCAICNAQMPANCNCPPIVSGE